MSGVIDNNELMKVFYEEVKELIDKMKSDLSNLIKQVKGKKGVTSMNKAKIFHEAKEGYSLTLKNLFRYAHTIKSSARAVGFNKLEELAKKLEHIFKKAEMRSIDIDTNIISIIIEGVEICSKLLKREKVSGYKRLLEQLNNIASN